jgi:hypothetical protein
MSVALVGAEPVLINLEQAKRAVVLCMNVDIPVGLWSKPGTGKSSVLRQIADALGWRYYDFRLSDKQPSDLGGMPVPDLDAQKLRALMWETLPFDSDEECLISFDEFDRGEVDTQNAALQFVLDREMNGHKLSPNARIVLAGNGTTDIGTSPLSKAAANRMVHLYIETESEGAFDSWLEWAAQNEVSPVLQGFAKINRHILNGKAPDGSDIDQLAEMAYATARSAVYADKLMQMADEVEFKTNDILLAVVSGCVGKAAATELIAFRNLYQKAPSIEEIMADPEHVAIPDDLGILHSLTMALTAHATRGKEEADKVARYGIRWTYEEPQTYLMRRLLDKTEGHVKISPAYQKWERSRDHIRAVVSGSDDLGHIHNGFTSAVLAAYPGSKVLPEENDYVNRMGIVSPNSGEKYTLAQRRKNLEPTCSCRRWITSRVCPHLDKVYGIAPNTVPHPAYSSVTLPPTNSNSEEVF